MKMDSRSVDLFFSKLRYDTERRGDMPKHVLAKKYRAFVDEQLRIEGTFKKNRKETFKKVYADSDTDEDLQHLKNAVKQYKSNKGQKSYLRKVFANTPMPKTNTHDKSNGVKTSTNNTSTEANASPEQRKSLKPIDNLTSGESETSADCEIGSNESAFWDVQKLINYFFLQKIDQLENIEYKKYKEYEKQGAIPKCLFRENLNGNYSRDSNSQLLKSKEKPNETDKPVLQKIPCSKNNSEFGRTDFSERHSNDSVIRLGEGTCTKPFFYVVPENPSPNFLLPRGSYYVVPRPADSASGHNIVVHPETEFEYEIKVNNNLEIKAPQSGSTNIRNMNDLGKEVVQKSDSHLNIGPKDVKLSEFWKNLEGNCETIKRYDKTPESSNNWSKDVALSPEENQKFKTVKEGLEEPENESNSGALEEAAATGQFPEELDFSYSYKEVQNLGALKAEPSAPKANSDTFLEENLLEDFAASENLERIIEDQFSRMLAALPESNIEELRGECELFQGDEVQVNRYIQEVQRRNRTHRLVLDMQSIFPDADPDYLHNQILILGDNDGAANELIDRLLDSNDYPKISNSHKCAERQRLWRIYVDKFNVSDYIRNVPNPKNFEVVDAPKSEERIHLDMEFLRSRYLQISHDVIVSMYDDSNKNLVRTCTLLDLDGAPLRLANSAFEKAAFDEAFLKEVCYIDNKKEIDEHLDNLLELKEMEVEEARLNNTFLFCPLCCNDELVTSEAVTCADGDVFCKDCIKRYIFVKLGEGVYKFSCPSWDCEVFFTYATLEKLLPDLVLSNIVKKQQAAEISIAKVDGLEFCPFCEFAYIPKPEDKIFKCQNLACLIETCRKCREVNHIPLHCEEIERPQDVEARKQIEEAMTEKLVRICPACLKKFVKTDGCNKMVCSCGTIVCYYCRRKVSGYEHFSNDKSSGLCPLYSNNAELHTDQVIRAGVEQRNRILEENPNIRILYDPTTNGI